ncbi:MAG: glycosyltransferase family 2 protein [Candidatus Eremiobacteraeota bacterium]|nr:glycosyltransferase family 2 protein [Candidatus Eremiobacteraeota bacterium]
MCLVRELLDAGFGHVILADDGSDRDHRAPFDAFSTDGRVRVVRHETNRGKGSTLKTAFRYLLAHVPEAEHVVTADADGQHRASDILAVTTAAREEPGRLVLGSRIFGGDVPLRSRFGNAVTRHVFRAIAGRMLADTQTGLRAFPRAMLEPFVSIRGERYEYEMNVLAHACRTAFPLEVPIATIYVAGNAASHFDPVRDSMRIYFGLLRFYFSSRLGGNAAG